MAKLGANVKRLFNPLGENPANWAADLPGIIFDCVMAVGVFYDAFRPQLAKLFPNTVGIRYSLKI